MSRDWPTGLTVPWMPLLRTVAALGALSGAQLFSLQKDKFRALSPEEGARVYSQITVQRSLLEVRRALVPEPGLGRALRSLPPRS